MGELRKDVGVGRSVGKDEGNVGKYGEVLQSGGRCGKVCWNVGEVWVVRGSMERCVWGVGRGVGTVLRWVEVKKVWAEVGVWEDVGTGLGSVKK